MSISASVADSDGNLVIKVSGRFDFSEHEAFRKTYESQAIEPSQFTVDLSDTTYLDSSALGMLLLLRDHAGSTESEIKIVNCNDDVRKLFSISNFDQLFSIS